MELGMTATRPDTADVIGVEAQTTAGRRFSR
jgi:hypothetical protein